MGDIYLVLDKDSFCHRGKSQLGIGLFIHEPTQGFVTRIANFWIVKLDIKMSKQLIRTLGL